MQEKEKSEMSQPNDPAEFKLATNCCSRKV